MQILCFLILVLFVALTTQAFAVTSTPTPSGPSATPAEKISQAEKLSEQISELKDRIASRVAQLNLVEKRGVIGIATEASGTKIVIKDLQNETRLIDVDELTKFSSPSAKSTGFGISDIEKGTKISVLGLYNKQSKRILARFVTVITLPQFISGQIIDVNKKDFTITVLSEDQKSTTIDIENVTKTSLYTKDADVTKAGFSKIAVGNRVHVVGFTNKKDSSRLTATRILLLPELPQNPHIAVPQTQTNQASPTPFSQ